MARHLAKCDKCGEIKEMVPRYYGYSSYNLPNGWENTDLGELCKKCYKDYVNFLKIFK